MAAPLKRSFVKLPLRVDAASLARELGSLPSWAFSPTLWPYPHQAIDLLLLRGGTTGTDLDFYSDEQSDHPLLARLPHMASLIAADGPLGGARYAFLFRMRPHGRALLHRDEAPIWRELHRVHVPLETNPGARLVRADGRAQHLAPGEVWTFDNQALHGAVNGDAARTHLILDVPADAPAMVSLFAAGELHDGELLDDATWQALGPGARLSPARLTGR